MHVESLPLSAVRLDAANVRLHDDRNLDAIKGSLARFGQQKPIVIDSAGVIRAGNGTYLAAKALGWETINVVRTELQGLEATAYAIADNRTSDLSTFDEAALAAIVAELKVEDALEGIGFDPKEIDELLAKAAGIQELDQDVAPALPDAATTRAGDLWVLGRHRLLCGDSSSREDVDRLLGGAAIHFVNTDPPYNVAVEPRSNNAIAAGLSSFGGTLHHQSLDLARHPTKAKATHEKLRPKDRPLANDFLKEADFDELLRKWFGNIARVLLPGRCFVIWGGYSNLGNYPPALKECGLYFSQAIVWDKQHPVLTRKDMMGCFELGYYGWLEGAAHQFFGPANALDLWQVKKVNPQAMVHLCLHPDALVLTEAGYRPIRAVRAGDRVYSGDGTFHAVTHVTQHAYASDDLFRIHAQGTVDASDNHPFLIWREGSASWMRADAVRPGDYTMTPLPADGCELPLGDLTQVARHDGRAFALRRVERVRRIPYKGDVWNLSVEGHPSFQTPVGLSHNTEKPVDLAARAIQYSSRAGENVLDLFGGSGSTLVAAEQTGRNAYLMELDALYCDVIVQRWEKLAGKTAVLEGAGAGERTFAEVAKLRGTR